MSNWLIPDPNLYLPILFMDDNTLTNKLVGTVTTRTLQPVAIDGRFELLLWVVNRLLQCKKRRSA